MNDSDGTEAAIMAATERALREHGYADLSISKIADEFGKSRSVLYYHYEDKDELLVAFLDHLIDRFSADLPPATADDPEAQLRSFLDRLLPPTVDPEQGEFQAALLDLRAQAAHNEAYRERFTATDRLLRDTVAAYVAAGVETGQFREVDPERTAGLVLAVVYGGMLERVTTDDPEAVMALRDALDAYVTGYLRTSG